MFFLPIHKISIPVSFLHYFKNLYKLANASINPWIFIMLNVCSRGKINFVWVVFIKITYHVTRGSGQPDTEQCNFTFSFSQTVWERGLMTNSGAWRRCSLSFSRLNYLWPACILPPAWMPKNIFIEIETCVKEKH